LPKLPRLTATEAEKLLLKAGFQLIRSKAATGYISRTTEKAE
jgi:predicted RNA binding protein YcfA (HicA-like mRNA interferase family)